MSSVVSPPSYYKVIYQIFQAIQIWMVFDVV